MSYEKEMQLMETGSYKADVYSPQAGTSFRVFVESGIIVKLVTLNDGAINKRFGVITDASEINQIFPRGTEYIERDQVIDPDKRPDSVFVECDRRAMANNIRMLKEEKQKTFWSAWPNGGGSWQLVGEPYNGCIHQFLYEIGFGFTGGQNVIK